MTEATYSDAKMKLRQEVLAILLKKYGHEGNNKAIYECADEWVEKYVISCLLYTSPSPRDTNPSRMPSSA